MGLAAVSGEYWHEFDHPIASWRRAPATTSRDERAVFRAHPPAFRAGESA